MCRSAIVLTGGGADPLSLTMLRSVFASIGRAQPLNIALARKTFATSAERGLGAWLQRPQLPQVLSFTATSQRLLCSGAAMKHNALKLACLLWRVLETPPACLPCTTWIGAFPIEKIALSMLAH